MFNQSSIDYAKMLLVISIAASIYTIVLASMVLHYLDRGDCRSRGRQDSPPPTFLKPLLVVVAPFVGAFLWVVIGPEAVDGRLDNVKRFSLKVAALGTAIATRLFAVALLLGIAHNVGGRK